MEGLVLRILAISLTCGSGCAPLITGDLSEFLLDGVPLSAHRIFVTSTAYPTGSISDNGDLRLADQICVQHARAAGLRRDYKAILGTEQSASMSARSRLDLGGPVYQFRADNTRELIASDAVDLFRMSGAYADVSSLSSVPHFDETYSSRVGAGVWTGSVVSGVGYLDCDWFKSSSALESSMTGVVQATPHPSWLTHPSGPDCTGSQRLYCISQ